MFKGHNHTVILMVFILALFSCGQKDATKAKDDKARFTIITSFYPIYIMTINVTSGVKETRVVNMTKQTTGCLHDYQLSPQDIKTLDNADVFVMNGAGMESFLDKVIHQRPNLPIIEASTGIPLLKDPETGEVNPHVWLNILYAATEVQTIAGKLAKLDPTNAAEYLSNASNYITKLTLLDKRMKSSLSPYKGKPIITFHEAFPYFAEAYGLKIAAVIEREPGSEPSAGDLAKTISLIKSMQVKALFAEPQYSSKSAATIAKDTGAKVYSLDPLVTGPDDRDSYLNTMESNLASIKAALQ